MRIVSPLLSQTLQFLYLNSAFAPCADSVISHLYRVCRSLLHETLMFILTKLALPSLHTQCFSVDGMLVINYSTSAAWG